MAHDVSRELRGEHGKWTKGGALLHRMSEEATAGKAQKGELQADHRVKYKTGSLGTVHHIDEKGTPHVVWDRGRGKPVATPAQHLTRIGGEKERIGAPSPPRAPAKIEYDRAASVGMLGRLTKAYGGDTYGWQHDVEAGRVKRVTVPVEQIRALQPSFPDTVQAYKDKLDRGEKIGVPVAVLDGGHYYLLDGNHKGEARVARGAKTLELDVVTPGKREETIRALAREPEVKTPPQLTQIAHPKSLKIAGSANRGTEDNKKMRREVLRASTIQAQHTPEMVGKTDVTITKAPHGERNTSTLASHTGRGNTLHVKPEVLIGSNAEAVRKANVGGWWVKTDAHHNLSDNVLIHEYGHGVHGLLISKGIVKSNNNQQFTDFPAEHELWNGFADALGVARPEIKEKMVTISKPSGKGYETRPMNRMDVGNWLYDNKPIISKQVSKYGSTNQNEMMAELWTEYKLSAKPRAPAKFFGDWVTSQLQKAGGG